MKRCIESEVRYYGCSTQLGAFGDYMHVSGCLLYCPHEVECLRATADRKEKQKKDEPEKYVFTSKHPIVPSKFLRVRSPGTPKKKVRRRSV